MWAGCGPPRGLVAGAFNPDAEQPWHYLDVGSGVWQAGLKPLLQVGLVGFDAVDLLDTSGLAVGDHWFCFAVDLVGNGNLDAEALFLDAVLLTVDG